MLHLTLVGAVSAAVPGPPPWLRGSGDDLEIRLHGEVLTSDGASAERVEMTGGMNHRGATEPIEFAVEGGRFEAWLPVNKSRPYSLWLMAESPSGALATQRINGYQLRQDAIDGLRLTLAEPTREVAVRVIHDDAPVAGATVRVDLGYNITKTAESDAEGVARFPLLREHEIRAFTAWTENHLLGGYQFGRKPPRNPEADEHEVELFACRDLTLRFVDAEGAPAEGVEFEFQVATPPPNYNYLGLVEPSRMTTDAAGEAIFRWLPDWESHHYYPDVALASGWVLDGDASDAVQVAGAVVYRVKRAAERKRVTGRVTTPEGVAPGGFRACLKSFQGEQENRSDHLYTYTDAQGVFSVDVLPGATYCAVVDDERWVGEFGVSVPYEPATGLTTEPVLSVVAGEEVEIVATRGPQRAPYANLGLILRQSHSYTRWENGEKRHGSGSRDWWLTTDASGKAVTHALPGELSVKVYQPLWRVDEDLRVRKGETARLELHRERDEMRGVTGALALAEGVEADLAGAKVSFGSLDGVYDYASTTTADADGVFTFETLGDAIGVFARTKDGRAAGSAVTDDPGAPLSVTLQPTAPLQGRLLGKSDEPMAGHEVRAVVRVEGDEDYDGWFVKSFEGARYETITDDRGGFLFERLPTGVEVSLSCDHLPGAEERTAYLGKALLSAGEERPPATFRLERRPEAAPPAPLAVRFAQRQRDARLSGYGMMVVACAQQDHLANFVRHNFVSSDKNENAARYMQQLVYLDPAGEGAELLAERGWQAPEGNSVHAWALDEGGAVLGSITIDADDENARAATAAFVDAHAPPPADAEEKWRHAFDEAEATGRRVWARVSGRYCGPCFTMTRWLDDHRAVLEKDYVLLKIDRGLDTNGGEAAGRVTRGGQHGIPFHAIFGAGGELLVDSEGPLGNIGSPDGFEGKNHLREMLLATRVRITDEEIDRLIDSL
ncbi:thioredoxin family protein [Pseudobythopirellula maris]|uniref:thioredoxin family protein n=1 Tax=Pseudobythopirellula maris TaxID=2527991 RepID=UPI0011B37516|nr:thioredoxin family protein [Pseudobythopirellula maris]